MSTLFHPKYNCKLTCASLLSVILVYYRNLLINGLERYSEKLKLCGFVDEANYYLELCKYARTLDFRQIDLFYPEDKFELKDILSESQVWEFLDSLSNRSNNDDTVVVDLIIRGIDQLELKSLEYLHDVIAQEISLLRTWDIFAALYLAAGGKSMDDMESALNWILSKGKKYINDLKSSKKAALKELLNCPTDFPDLNGLIEVRILKLQPDYVFKGIEYKIQGEPWNSESINTHYPHLYSFYGEIK